MSFEFKDFLRFCIMPPGNMGMPNWHPTNFISHCEFLVNVPHLKLSNSLFGKFAELVKTTSFAEPV